MQRRVSEICHKNYKEPECNAPKSKSFIFPVVKVFRTEFISAKQHDSSLFWSRSTKIQTFKKNTLMF